MLMNGARELLSVIIPVRNGARFLEECLASAEKQSGFELEILVVDDGSEDGSGDIARAHPGICVVRREPGGVGAARNTGLERARGNYVAFLDSDDIWHVEKTSRQLDILRAEPGKGGVLCRFRNFLDPFYPPPRRIAEGPFLEEKTGGMPILSTLLAHRRTMDRVGPFRTDLVSGEDLDWFVRASDLGVVFAKLPDVLVERRLHDANCSYRTQPDRGHLLDIVRASIKKKETGGRMTREAGPALGGAGGEEGGE